MMRSTSFFHCCLFATLAVLGSFSAATYGQTTPSEPTTVAGFTAQENANGGAVRARAPGHLVSAGIARQQEAIDLPGLGFRVTEGQDEEGGPFQDFLVQAVEEIFTNLITPFVNLLLIRAGGTPELPTNLPAATESLPVMKSILDSKYVRRQLVDRVLDSLIPSAQ